MIKPLIYLGVVGKWLFEVITKPCISPVQVNLPLGPKAKLVIILDFSFFFNGLFVKC
ncbi:hypothetical protein SLEP1_g46506 [Rubroshorea leprosula]|uniref:Uncharacterized protein n=1 Tax=Rubroshorea leprosula TaxID=152421 RepID=A0AAV5LPW3_9ROSI|nr:hypothetical protein SLEP1_g46506 [Rubroshorea leprosula]